MGLPDCSFVLDQTNLEACAATRDCNPWLWISCPLRIGVSRSRAALNVCISVKHVYFCICVEGSEHANLTIPADHPPAGWMAFRLGRILVWGCSMFYFAKNRLPYSNDAYSTKSSGVRSAWLRSVQARHDNATPCDCQVSSWSTVSEWSSNNVLQAARRIHALFSLSRADNDQVTVLPLVPMPEKKKTKRPIQEPPD